MLSVGQLYRCIYEALSNDKDIMNYLKIETNDDITKRNHIQSRIIPQKLTEYLPIISFYASRINRKPESNQVYTIPIVFNTYTNNDVNLALDISDKIVTLFDKDFAITEKEVKFESCWKKSYENYIGANNMYCFSVVINFFISI